MTEPTVRPYEPGEETTAEQQARLDARVASGEIQPYSWAEHEALLEKLGDGKMEEGDWARLNQLDTLNA
jgi:hypothetical protein